MTLLSLTSSVRGAECVASLVVRPFTELGGVALERFDKDSGLQVEV
jgi:hypothetical protein